MDAFELWVSSIQSASTRRDYGRAVRRLISAVGMTPQEVLDKVKAELRQSDATTYSQLVNYAKGHYTENMCYLIVMGLRRFLLDSGVTMLPAARLRAPAKVKPPTSMTWDQARRVIDAASLPYSLIYKLMLHSGWGVGEFLKFNTADTWADIKRYLAERPNAEYYRYNFSGRKRSRHQWYSLVRTDILKEIIANLDVPIRGARGDSVPLDKAHIRSAEAYFSSAFKTALKHSPVRLNGRPTTHELRDTYRTRASFVGCDRDAAEFSMGHLIDPRGYNKCYTDEAWMWAELKKIHGPAVATEAQVQAQAQELTSLRMELYKGELRRLQDRLDTIPKVPIYVQGPEGYKPITTPEETAAEIVKIKAAMREVEDKLRELG